MGSQEQPDWQRTLVLSIMAPPLKPYLPAGKDRIGLVARKIAATLIGMVVDDHRSFASVADELSGIASLRALTARDRGLAKAICLTALRHRGQIDLILSRVLDRKPPQKARHLLHTLHAAAAQILYMEVPERAAVDLAVTAIAEDRRTGRFAAMTNAVLHRICREKDSFALPVNAVTVFPQWLAGELRRDHGKQNADAIAAAIAREPMIDITVSPRLSMPQVQQLARELDALLLDTGSLRLRSKAAIRDLAGYDDGIWWVQDAASALAVRLLGNVEGMNIADVCAAPGGKTAQLASLGATVTALDVSAQRLTRLQENLARLKLQANVVAGDLLEWRPARKFDAILLDAPCSSTGTIRRHPDVMWTKTLDDAAALAALQKKLILHAVSLVKPGGLLVYANCSMLKREGETLVAELSQASEGFRLEPVTAGQTGLPAALINRLGALRTLPSFMPQAISLRQDFETGAREGDPLEEKFGGMDGFFACRYKVA